MPNYSDFFGDLCSGALSNLYYPPSSRGASLVFTNAAIGLAGRSAISHFFVMDWVSVWKHIAGGLLFGTALDRTKAIVGRCYPPSRGLACGSLNASSHDPNLFARLRLVATSCVKVDFRIGERLGGSRKLKPRGDIAWHLVWECAVRS